MNLRTTLPLCLILLQAALVSCSGPSGHDYPYRPVPFTSVQVTDPFWGQRLKASREVTIPLAFSKCEETGRYRNFEEAALQMHSDENLGFVVRGLPFDDTDVYKTIEGASYLLQTYPDPKLEAYIDSVLTLSESLSHPLLNKSNNITTPTPEKTATSSQKAPQPIRKSGAKNAEVEQLIAQLMRIRLLQRNCRIAESYQLLYDIDQSRVLKLDPNNYLYSYAQMEYFITSLTLNYHYRNSALASSSSTLGTRSTTPWPIATTGWLPPPTATRKTSPKPTTIWPAPSESWQSPINIASTTWPTCSNYKPLSWQTPTLHLRCITSAAANSSNSSTA